MKNPSTPHRALHRAGEEDVCLASGSGARMRSGAQLRQDVSPERKGSKKTSFERKALNRNAGYNPAPERYYLNELFYDPC